MLLRGWPNPPADEQLECHLDNARSADGRHVLIKGWAEGADSGTLYWLDRSPGSKPLRLDVVLEPREDVQAHLLGAGRPATSILHGFWAAVRFRAWGSAPFASAGSPTASRDGPRPHRQRREMLLRLRWLR
jgi:hypothetical protein